MTWMMDGNVNSFALVGTVRMLLAIACGMVIGWERKKRSKGAGIRTHCVVACASALMMMVSKYGFYDVVGYTGGVDPARIAAQIVSGVGFLGAGMIMVQRQTIVGLTTAAGIWATAGIGMAIGAGMYGTGVIGTILLLMIHLLLHNRLTNTQVSDVRMLTIYDVTESDFQRKTTALLLQNDIHISDVSVYKTKDAVWRYQFEIEIPKGISEEEIANWFSYEVSLELTQ